MNTALPAKKLAVLSVFTALSLIMFMIENLFPPLFIPGAKMGLANIFSLAALILYGPIEAFCVIAVRTFLGALFAGNFYAFFYSFSGGVVSMAVSALLLRLVHPKISLMAASILAAVMHNATQNAVFVLISQTPLMFSYLPYLMLCGILSGFIVGGVLLLVFKKVPRSVFERALL